MKSRIIDTLDLDPKRNNPDDTWFLYANNLMTSFGDLVRDDPLTRKHFLDLYCRLRLRKLDEVMLSSLVYNLPPAFFQDREWLDNLTTEKHDLPDTAITDGGSSWRPNDTSPFLLLGHVGTGKTTYLYNYFFVELPQRRHDVFAIMFDLNQAPIDESGLKQFIYREIETYLTERLAEYRTFSRQTILRIYEDRVKEYEASFRTDADIEEAKDRLVEKILTAKQALAIGDDKVALLRDFLSYYSRTYKAQIWLIFDNVDNHVFLSDFNAVRVLREIVAPLRCFYVVSLRYISAASAAEAGYLSSFRARRLKLSFPNLVELLKKRLYVFKKIARDSDNYYSTLKWTGDIQRVKDLYISLLRVLAILRLSKLLYQYLLPLSNYNLRKFLEIILTSFQSYYFFYDRFNNERYLPSPHNIRQRFIFSQLLKNGEYYNPHNIDANEQFIINIFENEEPSESFNQLIRLRILQKLVEHNKEVPVSQFRQEIHSVFRYSDEDICRVLRTFLRNDLLCIRFDPSISHRTIRNILERITPGDLELKGIYLALTFSGKLHYSTLIGDIQYIEIMKLSTYVDSRHQEEVQTESYQASLERRKRSTLAFIDYLLEEQASEKKEVIDDEIYAAKYEPLLVATRRSIEKQYDQLFGRARKQRNITNRWS